MTCILEPFHGKLFTTLHFEIIDCQVRNNLKQFKQIAKTLRDRENQYIILRFGSSSEDMHYLPQLCLVRLYAKISFLIY